MSYQVVLIYFAKPLFVTWVTKEEILVNKIAPF